MTNYEKSKLADFLSEHWEKFVESVGNDEEAEAIYDKIKLE